MKSKIFVLVIILVLVVSLGAQTAGVEGESPDPQITIYVVPPITDVKILPTSSISASYISSEISIVASPGEYEPASFVIHANEDVTSLEVDATELTGPSGSIIPSNNVDIRVVKCWYQGGYDLGVGRYGRFLTPELLLKDDSLVKVEGTEWNNPNGHNYLKLTSGEYILISERDDTYSAIEIIPIADRPVKDSSTLQPVDIPDGTNKQFWVTVKVPHDALSGIYNGRIELRTAAGLIGELQLTLEVLPIELSEPYLTYSLYYRGRLEDSGSISSENKNEEQFRAEMENLYNHGVTNPTIYNQDSLARIGDILTIRNEAGMGNQPFYYLGTVWGGDATFKSFVQSYGVTDIYLYGIDEGSASANREVIDNYHARGFEAFVALSPGNADGVADVLDLAIVSGDPSTSLANKYHSYGNRIFSYANPQVVPEFPETFRRRYGLLLWQNNYDGAMDYAYQHSYDDIWNDFDSGHVRDHVFAYPTMDGVIDTVQWEGFREAVDDVRYLTTLLNVIEVAKGEGKDTSEAENYLAALKTSDLTTKDLDVVRSEMIVHILSLQEEVPPDTTPPVITSVTALNILPSSATIIWTTNEPATSQVEYGKTTSYGSLTPLDTNLVTSHSISLTGLTPETIYHFRVKSEDAANNPAISTDYTFTTSAPDTIPPIISAVNASPTHNSATITWATDEPATSQVEYGPTEELGLSTDLDASLITNHSINLTGLDSETTFYTVKSKDASDNLATSDIYSFTALPPPHLSISFISPTEADGAVVDRNWTEVNVSVDSSYDTSSFIDWNYALVGYWNLNENSGSTAEDKSTYGNNGTLMDGPQWTTGKFGYALEFDGANDYVEVPYDPSLDTDEITVEAWIKPDVISGSHAIAERYDWVAGKGIFALRQVDDDLVFYIVYGTESSYAKADGVFEAGAWYHVVGTYDQATIKVYVNGELEAEESEDRALLPSDDILAIGRTSHKQDNYFQGSMDEVRIWNRALSPEEIKASYNTRIHSLSHEFTDLADGTYEYYAYTTDTNGNSAQTETRILTVDTTPGGYLPGDANQDGSVNILDIVKVERIIMGLDEPTPGADANGDGNINSADMTKIELIIMGG